jgi:hypothetical protein
MGRKGRCRDYDPTEVFLCRNTWLVVAQDGPMRPDNAQMQAAQGIHALSTMNDENARYPAGPCFPPTA